MLGASFGAIMLSVADADIQCGQRRRTHTTTLGSFVAMLIDVLIREEADNHEKEGTGLL
jgi:hypothetical protein